MILLVLLSLILLPAAVKATSLIDFWLDSLTSEVYLFECAEGDSLDGSFVATLDREYYSGDQQKYDLLVGWEDGVDFYIFNQSEFEHWSAGSFFCPLCHRTDVTELTWNFAIQALIALYIVFDNDSSVYGKQVEGSIHHSNRAVLFTSIILIIGCSSLAIFVPYISSSKRRKSSCDRTLTAHNLLIFYRVLYERRSFSRTSFLRIGEIVN